jgi:hypothetical protein
LDIFFPPKPADSTNNSKPVVHVKDRARLLERWRKYVSEMQAAISGQNGSGKLFAVACTCFRFALTFDEALLICRQYNQRCKPVWSFREIKHKLDSAQKRVNADGDFGKLVTK